MKRFFPFFAIATLLAVDNTVTNLNDSGAGSLRAALTTDDEVNIEFTVAGTISLSSALDARAGLTTALTTSAGAIAISRPNATAFDITSGTLAIRDANITIDGNINIAAATNLFYQFTGTTTFAGDLIGTGRVEGPRDAGQTAVLIFTGNGAAFTGVTDVALGTIRLGSANALGSSRVNTVSTGTLNAATTTTIGGLTGNGATTINDNVTLTVEMATPQTYSGTISGANASLAKAGVGTWTLNSATGFTGRASVTEGTLSLTNASALSESQSMTIGPNGTLVIGTTMGLTDLSGAGALTLSTGAILTDTSSNDLEFSGTSSGAGSLIKAGSGTLTLSGACAHTGPTGVSSGTLSLTGTLSNSAVTVGSGATLRGTGSMSSATIEGICFPGTSIGTLTVTGNYVQSNGSTLHVEIAGNGTASLVDVGGTATIGNNTTLQVTALGGFYRDDQTYTVLNADGGLSGTFDTFTVTNPEQVPGGNFSVNYTGNAVQVILDFNEVTPCHITQPYLVANLANQASRFQINLTSYENDQRLLRWKGCRESRIYSYLVGDFATGHTREAGDSLGASYHIGGVQFGAYGIIAERWVVGGYGGYSRSTSDPYNRCAYASGNNWTMGLLAQYMGDVYSLEFALLDTFFALKSERFNGGNSINVGSPTGNGLATEVKCLFNGKTGPIDIRPLIGLRYMRNKMNTYTEDLSKTDQQIFHSWRDNLLYGMAGIFLSADIQTSLSHVQPHIKAVWMGQFGTNDHSALLETVQPTEVSTTTVKVENGDKRELQLSAGLTGTFRRCVSLDATYETNVLKAEAPNHSYRATLTWRY